MNICLQMENTFVVNISAEEVESSAAELIDLAYINGILLSRLSIILSNKQIAM